MLFPFIASLETANVLVKLSHYVTHLPCIAILINHLFAGQCPLVDPVVHKDSLVFQTSDSQDNPVHALLGTDEEWKSTNANTNVSYVLTIKSLGDIPQITDVEVETSGASSIKVTFLQTGNIVHSEVSQCFTMISTQHPPPPPHTQ